MKFIENPLIKRIMTLRYLRDELTNVKYLSPKGMARLKQLESEINHMEAQLDTVKDYQELA